MSFHAGRVYSDLDEQKDALRLSSPDGEASATIHPRCGGTVSSVRLSFGSRSAEILYRPAESDDPCAPGLFAGRLLWPFNDRIHSGVYRFGGTEYHLTRNDIESGDAIHGFLYKMPMNILHTRADRDSAEIVLTAHLQADKEPGYPFDLTLEARYRLTRTSFTIHLATRNTGTTTAPFSTGWHPYFTLPVPAPTVDTYTVHSDLQWYYPVNESLIPTGETVPVTAGPYDFTEPRPLGSNEIDICMSGSRFPRTSISSGGVSLEMIQTEGFTHTQFFVPPGRRAIAIEPVTAAANAFSTPGLGLTVLEPDDIHHAECTVRSVI